MPDVDPALIRSFASAQAFEEWLRKNHLKASEVYIRVFKKGSGVPSVTCPEALEVCLCYGWIDAIRKSYDEQSFLQRYTRRREKSAWSQINREHVARLIAAGRMTAHGQAAVDAAKADGRWAAAYAGPAKSTIPSELRRAIAANPRALATFEQLDKRNLFALSHRLGQLKTPAGREKRIAAFVEMLAAGKTPHPLPASRASKAKKQR